MDDQGAEASEKQGQRKERTEVRDGADRALQRRHLVEFDTGERPRLLIQEARFTRDEQGTEPRGVEVGHREQSILLRASQLQLGDDVRDVDRASHPRAFSSHRFASSSSQARPFRRSANCFPWPIASSMELCSHRPYRPME